MLRQFKARWPILGAILFFLLLIACIGPWSELPLHDDWQYSHLAKTLAARGTFRLDVAVAPTVVGQSLMAWPIIQVFGFSHLALRMLTLALSMLILVELDYLLVLATVSPRVRFVALCALVANPFFLHLATTFMTENYGYFVALFAACVWFRGRRHVTVWPAVTTAALAGFSFWIRQFCALVFPALMLAEWIAGGPNLRSARSLVRKHAAAIFVWLAIVGIYFPWAKATGDYLPQFSQPLSQILEPDPTAFFVESGVYLFYLTFFFAPFLVGYGSRERPSIAAVIPPVALALTASFAWKWGAQDGPPSVALNSVFPFLNDVFANYGVGPITFSDFYWDKVATRPSTPEFPWLVLEVCTVIASLAWVQFFRRTREKKNEIGVFGVCFAIVSFVGVALPYRYAIFDRYHYPGILGFTIAVAVFFPKENVRRLISFGSVWIAGLAVFSALSLHDYFRWQEARAMLLSDARNSGIGLSEIDAGFEPNGWNVLEGESLACGQSVGISCRSRPYHIGLEQLPSDSLVFSRPIDAWFVSFPDVKLLKAARSPIDKP